MFEFNTGDLVLLTLDPSHRNAITPGLREFDGRKFRVSRVKSLKGQSPTNGGVYYELKGCESKYGTPYGIFPMWIQPMRELKRK